MKLTKQSLPLIEATFAAKAAKGATDAIFFDDQMKRFGLRLRASGHKSWVIQFEKNGRSQRVTLGPVAVLSVEQARHLAREQLAKVDLGQDVSKEKAEAKIKARRLFGAVVQQYLAARQADLLRGELRQSSFGEIKRYLQKTFQGLHRMALTEIQRIDVTNILRDNKPTAAVVARSVLATFFTWCIEQGFCEASPLAGSKRAKPRQARHRVLDNAELVKVWNACLEDDYGKIVRLLILTGARRDEIAAMQWKEFDSNNRTWTLPVERAKNRRPLILTLPPMAWDIIASVSERGFNPHLFGSGPNGFTHWASKTALDQRSGVTKPKWVLHDLRRTAATGMIGLGVQPHHVEAVLNHVGGHKGGVAGIYNRATYKNEIRSALIIWADHVASIVSGEERKIIPLQVG